MMQLSFRAEQTTQHHAPMQKVYIIHIMRFVDAASGPSDWKDDGELAALSDLAFDAETTAVTVDDMFDNGKSKARAAHFPRSVAVDAVKPFCQARDMMGCDTVTMVDHDKADAIGAQ